MIIHPTDVTPEILDAFEKAIDNFREASQRVLKNVGALDNFKELKQALDIAYTDYKREGTEVDFYVLISACVQLEAMYYSKKRGDTK